MEINESDPKHSLDFTKNPKSKIRNPKSNYATNQKRHIA
jgi:hypothetical protein